MHSFYKDLEESYRQIRCLYHQTAMNTRYWSVIKTEIGDIAIQRRDQGNLSITRYDPAPILMTIYY